MWLLYTLLHMFLIAGVNYLDEYLTHSSTTKKTSSVHERIGGVLVISTLMGAIGLCLLLVFAPTLHLSLSNWLLAVGSAVGFAVMALGYFYLFQYYSAHQVVPLFGLTSAWLLLFELCSGAVVTLPVLAGIGVLVAGAYLLDTGAFRFKFPSRLVVAMLGITFAWATALLMVKMATTNGGDPFAVYFWQLAAFSIVGGVIFTLISPYRRGFLNRLKQERQKFIVPSFLNESMAQLSFLFSVLAVSAAPLAAYVPAATGLQSLFLLALLWLFPLNQRNTINIVQWGGVALIATGIALLELS